MRRVGAVLVCGSLLMLPGCIAPGLSDIGSAEKRAEEIKSWPRVTVDPDHRPHVLVIHTRTDKPRPFVYFLAETGLFDVYAVEYRYKQPPSVRHFEVKQNSECQKSRSERTEMIALTGWRACAMAVPTDTAPEDGLIFYVDEDAPHAFHDHASSRLRSLWTMELSVRHGPKEELVAFDEFVDFPEYRGFFFHPLPEFTLMGPMPPVIGPVFVPRELPMHRVLGGNLQSKIPDPAAFLLASLGLDESAIVPPLALTSEERRQEIDHLAAAGDAAATRRALEIVAASPLDPVLYPAVARLAANPVTSRQVLIQQPLEYRESFNACAMVDKLLRYRDAFIEGCSKSSLQPGQCAQLTYPRGWLEGCGGYWEPIWQDRDSSVQHVFIANPGSEAPTSVALLDRAGFTEIRVPADRGAIDLVVMNQVSRILLFTGDVSCIVRLTLIEPPEGSATGVAGIDAARVRFAAKSLHWMDPKNPLKGDLADILGGRPDAMLIGSRGSIDLDALLKPPRSPTPCAAAGTSPVSSPKLRDDGILELRATAVLTAPPLLPRDLPAYPHKPVAGQAAATWADLVYAQDHNGGDEFESRINRLLASDEPELVAAALGVLQDRRQEDRDFAQDRIIALAFSPGLASAASPIVEPLLSHLDTWAPPAPGAHGSYRTSGPFPSDARARAMRRLRDHTLTHDQRRIFFRIIICGGEEMHREGFETLLALKSAVFVETVIAVGYGWAGSSIWHDSERDRLIARMSDVPTDRLRTYLDAFAMQHALSDQQPRRIVEQLRSRLASAPDYGKRAELNRLIVEYSEYRPQSKE